MSPRRWPACRRPVFCTWRWPKYCIAEPEGYVRVFVDEGQPLANLLRQLASRPSGPAEREASPGQAPALIEPLSEREREVLRFMAEGLTNTQIARRLTLALDTVKAHIHHISGKLGAQNRAHAVACERAASPLAGFPG